MVVGLAEAGESEYRKGPVVVPNGPPPMQTVLVRGVNFHGQQG